MKQLKFMLAAATAIGIATVVQAAEALASTNFEDEKPEAFPGSNSEWVSSAPDSNFSEIVNDTSMLGLDATKYTKMYGSTADTHTKSLSVDTGLGFLLRYLRKDQGEPVPVENVYIDTMVQFTVTPDGAEPTPTEEDKLILFAKEVNNTVKLHVISSDYTYDPLGSVTHNVVTTETSSVVHKDMWYRLTIKSSTYTTPATEFNKVNAFEIYIDGALVDAGDVLLSGYLNGQNFPGNTTLFPSIQGATNEAGVKAVGFSGEGKVDDLVFTTEYPFEASTIDFTLTMNGGSPVSVTIGNTDYPFGENNVVKIPAATTKFTVKYNSDYFASTLNWSDLSGCTATDADVTLNTGVTGASATLTLVNNASANPPSVNDSTTAASVGINSGAFKDATGGELSKLLSWAIAKGVSKNVVNEIPPFEDETGNATNDVQAAYLLNCEVAEVATKKGEFKFTPNDFYKLMGSGLGATNLEIDKEDYNGEFVLEGATTLKDEISGKPDWSTAAEAPKFFRARLTK